MIAAPWYLLAGGIGLVLLGYLVDGFSGSGRNTPRTIHHKLRDEDIINSLNDQEALSTGSAICLLGYLLVGISILWRIARVFT